MEVEEKKDLVNANSIYGQDWICKLGGQEHNITFIAACKVYIQILNDLFISSILIYVVICLYLYLFA